MNYKYFIIAIYLIFVSLIMMMVFRSCGQKIELESGDYYNEELRYQSRIDAKNLGNPYRDSFRILKEGDSIRISGPAIPGTDSVRIEFRKPDNASADRYYVFPGPLVPPLKASDLSKGVYGLNIRIFTGKGEHLIEKTIKL